MRFNPHLDTLVQQTHVRYWQRIHYDQHFRRWSNIVQLFYKCFVFAEMTPILLQTSHSFHINCVERIEERKATETKWRITSLLVTFTTPKYQSDSLSLATRWGPRLYLFKDRFCFVQNSQLSIRPAPARILISDDKTATSSEYRLPSIYGGHSRF